MMKANFNLCIHCPAFFLLTEERKKIIEKREFKRDKYISSIETVRLILLGESVPRDRYFYDLETYYNNRGLRYTLKKEFRKLDVDDGSFLQSFNEKGIVLFDCALCPIHKLENNVKKREAATYCFLNHTQMHIIKYQDIPIVTIFPNHRGFLKTRISSTIMSRIIANFSFTDQSGLNDLYEKIKTNKIDGNL